MNRLNQVLGGTASVLSLAWLACAHTPAAPAEAAATSTPAANPSPSPAKWDPTLPQACNVYLPDAAAPRQLLLEGRAWGPEWPAELALQVWPLDTESVAVSFRRGGEYLESDPRESVLYRLDCSGTRGLEVLAAQDFADFGRALLDLNRGRLLYSAGGLWALDLASLETQRIGPKPAWSEPGCEAADAPVRDVLVELRDDQLLVRRYAACGPSGAVIGHELWLEGASAYANQTARRRSPVATVARDPSGTLWLGDGVACNIPGHVEAHTQGLIWRSRDAGQSWTALALQAPTAEEQGATAPVRRIEAGQNPDQLVALTAICNDQSNGAYGGNLYVSRNGGKGFARLALPSEFGDGNFRGGVANFELINGDIDRIRAWPHSPGAFDRPAWESHDGGAHWTLSSDAQVGESLHTRWIAGDGWQFRATDDGLLKSRVGQDTGQIVFRSLELQDQAELCLKAQSTTRVTRSPAQRQRLQQRLDQQSVPWTTQGEHYFLTAELAQAQEFVTEGISFRREPVENSTVANAAKPQRMRIVPGPLSPTEDWRPFFESLEVLDGACPGSSPPAR